MKVLTQTAAFWLHTILFTTLICGAKPANGLIGAATSYGWLPELSVFDWDTIYDDSASTSLDSIPGSRLHRLLSMARAYALHSEVPYVWGGQRIGNSVSCQACRECLKRQNKKGKRLETRHRACEACKDCGVDCSHFVNQVFTDAGLGYPYSSTRDFLYGKHNSFKNIGNDVSNAQAGDLLVYRRHVVLLLSDPIDNRADFAHVSRTARNDGLGGIELLIDQDLTRYRGKILKILRHTEFFKAPNTQYISLR